MQKPDIELAVKHRLDRRLAEKRECLRHFSRNAPGLNEFGNYYIAELNTDNIIQTNVDLEALARKEGVIK
jgi:hypothetical protein